MATHARRSVCVLPLLQICREPELVKRDEDLTVDEIILAIRRRERNGIALAWMITLANEIDRLRVVERKQTMAIQPGTKVTLKTGAHRYYGGEAVVLKQERRGKRLMYLVRRLGDIGCGQREISISDSAFYAPSSADDFIPIGA